ncbi:YfhO family protein [Streptomyces purpureus]|uniref:YfhO family protein n=1 Tax=Streptomyces purpureus TaxID=1951 RepID=UPI0003754380|nr:YfhO family protein [Streptomyces purpureus]
MAFVLLTTEAVPAEAERAPHHRPRPRRLRLRAAVGAAVLSCVVFCLGGVLAGSHPFGPTTRNIVDLGNQYLPYHSYWRDLLLGRTDGDLFLNWTTGYGSNFLGDVGTYLSSPFDLLVVAFPADRLEPALYVITAAKVTAAGAAMATALLTLRRGPWPVAAVLGAAYALSGWTFNYGAYVPMWLDGLIAFPLLCLAAEWSRTARRPVLGPLVVALAWIANFYTAYMATIGAAIVLAVRLLTTEEGAPGLPAGETRTGLRRPGEGEGHPGGARPRRYGEGSRLTGSRAAERAGETGTGLRRSGGGEGRARPYEDGRPTDGAGPAVEGVVPRRPGKGPRLAGLLSCGDGTRSRPSGDGGGEDRSRPSRSLRPSRPGWWPTARAADKGGPRTGPRPRPGKVAALMRAVRTVGIGVGLASPVFVVVHAGTQVADPTPAVTFAAVDWTEVFARLLPGTASVASPALHIGTLALLLALTLPFNRALALRPRLVWTAAICLVALSTQWEPTHLLWHAGASPNGIPYRQAFVLCGLLLIAAWLSAAQGLPRPPVLLAAGGLLAVMAFAARGSTVVDRWSYPVLLAALAAGAVAAAAVVLGGRYAPGSRVLPAVAVVLLVAAQAGEGALGGSRVERRQLAQVSWAPPLGPWHEDMARATAREDAWPRHRTDPGGADGGVPGGNDSMIAGGQGADHYSSLTAEIYSGTLSSLGFGHYAKGRHVVSLDNPVTDAIFSVGTRMRATPSAPVRLDAPPRATITATHRPVPPLVTVRRDLHLPGADGEDTDGRSGFGDDAFANQELLLGARVYDVPTPTPAAATAPGTLTAACPAGAEVYFWAPGYRGTATLGDARPVAFAGKLPAVRAPMRRLGTVPASGEVRIALHSPDARPALPRRPVGCLVPERLDAAVRQLTATGATRVEASGHTLSATLPPGSTGTAVVAVPRISGWTCAAGDQTPAPARRHLGLLAVPLDGTATTISCSFRPPGLRLGAGIGGIALAALLALAWHHRSRPANSPAPPGNGRKEFT